MFDENAKNQNMLWWIASIAVSVVCCSALFVLFASYLETVKTSIENENLRLSILEQRQDRILAEIQASREHGVAPTAVVAPAAAAPASAETAPAPTPDSTMAPATAVGSGAPGADATKTAAPDIAVPTMPATPDKK